MDVIVLLVEWLHLRKLRTEIFAAPERVVGISRLGNYVIRGNTLQGSLNAEGGRASRKSHLDHHQDILAIHAPSFSSYRVAHQRLEFDVPIDHPIERPPALDRSAPSPALPRPQRRVSKCAHLSLDQHAGRMKVVLPGKPESQLQALATGCWDSRRVTVSDGSPKTLGVVC